MRLDQDINFEVGGIPCVMCLDTTAMGAVKGDLWIIQPRDPVYVEGHPNKREANFISRISGALLKLGEQDGEQDEEGDLVREPRQQYGWQSHDDHAYLQVEEDGEWTLAQGIMTSLPDWDGNSFDFFGSYRLARLLADWKDAIPEIKFTRSNGTAIEYEKFIEHGGNPLVGMLDAFDDVMDL